MFPFEVASLGMYRHLLTAGSDDNLLQGGLRCNLIFIGPYAACVYFPPLLLLIPGMRRRCFDVAALTRDLEGSVGTPVKLTSAISSTRSREELVSNRRGNFRKFLIGLNVAILCH